MTAGVLLLIQLVFSARLRVLDHIFSLNKLYRFHRINAVMIAVIALLHPLFVFAPEDISNLPIELKYWPEVLGAVLLLVIWMLVATGIWRLFLNFSFQRWWLFHRIITFLVVMMLLLHVLNVSDNYR